ATYTNPDWDQATEAGSYVHGVVSAVRPGMATVKLGKYIGLLTAADIAWTKAKDPAVLLKIGDLVYVRVLDNPLARPEVTPLLHVALEQESGVQGALLAIENYPADVNALLGGRRFPLHKFYP